MQLRDTCIYMQQGKGTIIDRRNAGERLAHSLNACPLTRARKSHLSIDSSSVDSNRQRGREVSLTPMVPFFSQSLSFHPLSPTHTYLPASISYDVRACARFTSIHTGMYTLLRE